MSLYQPKTHVQMSDINANNKLAVSQPYLNHWAQQLSSNAELALDALQRVADECLTADRLMTNLRTVVRQILSGSHRDILTSAKPSTVERSRPQPEAGQHVTSLAASPAAAAAAAGAGARSNSEVADSLSTNLGNISATVSASYDWMQTEWLPAVGESSVQSAVVGEAGGVLGGRSQLPGDAEYCLDLPQHTLFDQAAKYLWGEHATPHQFQYELFHGVRLCGRDAVCCLSTGSGKTGTCALLSLVIPGCHILVQPTRALLQTTATELWSLGVPVALIPTNGHKSHALSAMKNGKVPSRAQCHKDLSAVITVPSAKEGLREDGFSCILLTTAEQLLNSASFFSASSRCAAQAGCLFIDEVHLNEEWADFRPDLQHLAATKINHGYRAVALSATLAPPHVKRLERTLQLQNTLVIREPLRINASVTILDVCGSGLLTKADGMPPEDDDDSKLSVLLKIIRCSEEGRKTLIFLNNKDKCRKLARELTTFLKQDHEGGSSAGAAGDKRQRATRRVAVWHHSTSGEGEEKLQTTAQKNLNSWMSGDAEVIVATVGLAVGVHNTACDDVVLFEPPDSISQLVQMAGRCGRQTRCPGRVTLLYDPADIVAKWARIQTANQVPAEDSVDQQVQNGAFKRRLQQRLSAFHEVDTLLQFHSHHGRSFYGPSLGNWVSDMACGYFSGASIAKGCDLSDGQLVDAAPVLSVLGTFLKKNPRANFTPQIFKSALLTGLSSSVLNAETLDCKQSAQALQQVLHWLHVAKMRPHLALRLLRVGHDAGYIKLWFCGSGCQAMGPPLPNRQEERQLAPLWLDGSVDLAPSCTQVSAAVQYVSSSTPLEGIGLSSTARTVDGSVLNTDERKVQHTPTEAVLCGRLSNAARDLNAMAGQLHCCLVLKDSHFAHGGRVSLYYACSACSQAGGVRSTVLLDIPKLRYIAVIRGQHDHIEPVSPADLFDPSQSAAGIRVYEQLPLHPLVARIVKEKSRSAHRPSPMVLEQELSSLVPEEESIASTPFKTVPKKLAAEGGAVLEALASSGLGHKHGIHLRRPNSTYISNQYSQASKPEQGQSLWDAFFEAIQGNDSFVEKSCFGEAGSTNDSWLFVQTASMQSMSQSDIYIAAATRVVYEDDTGGTVKYRSKLFVWMIRSPVSGFALPLAYLLYTPGEPIDSARSDGLVQSLVWAYELIEARSNGKLQLTGKMMDKCSHGQAAWAIFQASKVKRAVDALIFRIEESAQVELKQHSRALQVACRPLRAVPSLSDGTLPIASSVNSAEWTPVASAVEQLHNIILHPCFDRAITAESAGIQDCLPHSTSLQTAIVAVRGCLDARLFLCHFHALKACNDNLLGSVTDDEDRTLISCDFKALFRSKSFSEMHAVMHAVRSKWDKKYPRVSKYLEKQWISAKWLDMWARWQRSDRDMDHTTNLVESHWQVLKYKVLYRRINLDPRRLFALLLGLNDELGTGGLVGFMFRREQSARGGLGPSKRRALTDATRRRLGRAIYELHVSSRLQRAASKTQPIVRVVDSERLVFNVESSKHSGTELVYMCALKVSVGHSHTALCDCPDGSGGRCKHIVACAMLADKLMGHSEVRHVYSDAVYETTTKVQGRVGPGCPQAAASSPVSSALPTNASKQSNPSKTSLPSNCLAAAKLLDAYYHAQLGVRRTPKTFLQECLAIPATSPLEQSSGQPVVDVQLLNATDMESYARATQGTGHFGRRDRGSKRKRVTKPIDRANPTVTAQDQATPQLASRIEHRRSKTSPADTSLKTIPPVSKSPRLGEGKPTATGSTAAPTQASAHAPAAPAQEIWTHKDCRGDQIMKVRIRKVGGMSYTLVPPPAPEVSSLESSSKVPVAAAESVVASRPGPAKAKSRKHISHPLHNKTQTKNNIRLPGNKATERDWRNFGLGSIVFASLPKNLTMPDGPVSCVYGVVLQFEKYREPKSVRLVSAVWFDPSGNSLHLTESLTTRLHMQTVSERGKVRLLAQGPHTPSLIMSIANTTLANLGEVSKLGYQQASAWVARQGARLRELRNEEAD
jgi:superfamily II DNA helicase RecQ